MAYQDGEFVAQAMPMGEDPDGEYFESRRSSEQKLSFKAAQAEFSLRKVDFSSEQMVSLMLVNQDGFYTNLALLLSDQS